MVGEARVARRDEVRDGHRPDDGLGDVGDAGVGALREGADGRHLVEVGAVGQAGRRGVVALDGGLGVDVGDVGGDAWREIVRCVRPLDLIGDSLGWAKKERRRGSG